VIAALRFLPHEVALVQDLVTFQVGLARALRLDGEGGTLALAYVMRREPKGLGMRIKA
jgi:hypothetical protein